jgi:hypothetical protein
MTNAERMKVLTEQAEFLRREADNLKSLAQSGAVSGQVNVHPSGLGAIADALETISKYVKSVAEDMRAEN